MSIPRIEGYVEDVFKYLHDNPFVNAVVYDLEYKPTVWSDENTYIFKTRVGSDAICNLKITFGKKVNINSVSIDDEIVQGLWEGDYYHILSKFMTTKRSLIDHKIKITLADSDHVNILQFKCKMSIIFFNTVQRDYISICDCMRTNDVIHHNDNSDLRAGIKILSESVYADQTRALQLYLPNKSSISTFIRHDGDNSLMYRVLDFLLIDIIVTINPRKLVATIEKETREDYYINLDEYKKRHGLLKAGEGDENESSTC